MAATQSPAARSGRLPVLAKYDVLEELGHGGMATVYRAHDKRLGRDVAIKVLHPHLRESEEVAHRFAVEAKAVAKLHHANIVEVFDVSSVDEAEQYLVVELVRGATLRKLLQKHGALPPEVSAALAMELLNALAHAHAAGVVHRDVKPENVMVEHRPGSPDARSQGAISGPPTSDRPVPSPRSAPADKGDRVIVKLTDFGIAKLLDAQGVTSTGQVLGSPAHMAPEQIEGGEVDGRADVFGLGVLLYECMVGHLPFEGNNPAQVLRRVLDGTYPSAERERPTVGKRWSQILDRALARCAEDRFADANEMRDAIFGELSRLGIGSARPELEAWFDDPDAYAEQYDKKTIAKLCELGAAARRENDALSAAADYNRALAYAPADPALLKIVSSMHRAETRLRVLKRAAPLFLGVVALGASSFFVARALKSGPAVKPVPSHDAVGVASTRAPASAPLAASVAPSSHASARPPPVIVQTVAKAAAVHVHRAIVLSKVLPPNGVRVTVDGDPAGDAVTGSRFMVDDKPHELVFTCALDLCEPMRRAVGPGDKDESVGVDLHVKDATLVVDGTAGRTYGIEQYPSIALFAGAPARVPMSRGNDRVVVIERETGRTSSVLLRAGRESHASFSDPLP